MSLLAPETIDLTSLPWLSYGERRLLPNIPALYFVSRDDAEVVYIGQTKSLCIRWERHDKVWQFQKTDRIAWFAMDDAILRVEAEKACIQYWRPRFNTKHMRELSSQNTRQTAVRVDPETLRLAKFYLDEEGSNLQEFLSEQLKRYVAEREQAEPRRAAVSA